MTDYEKKVNRKRNLITKHQKELQDLLSQCPHTDVEAKSRYYSGDYYDKAHTTYWNQCKLCGAKSPDTVETHSYYG